MEAKKTIRTYWSNIECLYPLSAILFAFGIFILVILLLKSAEGPEYQFRFILDKTGDYSEKIAFARTGKLFSSGLEWLLGLYLHCIAFVITVICCWYIIGRTLADFQPRHQWYVRGGLIAVVIGLIGLLSAADTFVALPDLIGHISQHVLPPLLEVVGWTNMAGVITTVLILAAGCSILLPQKNPFDPNRKIRYLNALLYCSAAFLVTRMYEARTLYGFASTFLVDEQLQVAKLHAPIISMVIGGVFSSWLAVMYLSVLFGLQRQAARAGTPAPIPLPDHAKAPAGPGTFLSAHWIRILAILSPALPGIAETLARLGAGG